MVELIVFVSVIWARQFYTLLTHPLWWLSWTGHFKVGQTSQAVDNIYTSTRALTNVCVYVWMYAQVSVFVLQVCMCEKSPWCTHFPRDGHPGCHRHSSPQCCHTVNEATMNSHGFLLLTMNCSHLTLALNEDILKELLIVCLLQFLADYRHRHTQKCKFQLSAQNSLLPITTNNSRKNLCFRWILNMVCMQLTTQIHVVCTRGAITPSPTRNAWERAVLITNKAASHSYQRSRS